ncbi:zinc ribbon domain-containing protein [Halomarina rubra]|uniref:Zinc ribbon domain-containing protein n=1 Tax=Halomarina rubra TaxID=2071873 RepID=A0ABD6AS75_9EURY|nr:zinc ribbon domain-containing protein [Halomarina rubra]
MTRDHGYDEKFCKSCGDTIKIKAEICPSCGVRNGTSASSSDPTAFCTSCGEEVNAAAELCPNCGVRQSGNQRSGINISDMNIDVDSQPIIMIVQLLAGGFFLLAGIGAFADAGESGVIVSIITGTLLIGIGVVLIPQFRQRLQSEHSVFTFGETASVDETTVQSSSSPCTSCNGPVAPGLRRQYKKEKVFLGVTLKTIDSGENVYCQSCANAEVSPTTIPAAVGEASS